MTKEWDECMNLQMFPGTAEINSNLTAQLIARIFYREDRTRLEVNLVAKTKREKLKYTGQCRPVRKTMSRCNYN